VRDNLFNALHFQHLEYLSSVQITSAGEPRNGQLYDLRKQEQSSANFEGVSARTDPLSMEACVSQLGQVNMSACWANPRQMSRISGEPKIQFQ